MSALRVVGDLVRHREMLRNLVRRDLVVRYQRSSFGVLLALGVPVLVTTVFTAFFPRLMPGQDVRSYAFLVFIGYMAWDYFARSIAIAVDVLRGHANLIGKVAFPLAVLPFSVCVSVLVHLAIGLTLGVAGNAAFGSGVQASLWAAPLWLGVEFLLVSGAAFLVAVLGVLFRDAAQLVAVLSMLLFYATPVFWSPDIVPLAAVRELLPLNPLYHVVLGLRDAIVAGEPPRAAALGYAAAWGAVLFAAGSVALHRARWRIAEELG